MITAAALCPAPPLLAPELTGGDPVLPALRQACLEATARLLRTEPEVVVVVGAAPQTRAWDGASTLNLASFAPALAAGAAAGTRSAGTRGLPAPLGLGALLLDQAGYAGPRILQAIGQDEASATCVELGRRLGESAERAALLVLADGSARRTRKAPGHLDERSAAFDAEVERAVRSGDLAALERVDPVLARELMATGRPAWQVLSGALHGAAPGADVLYSDDPFGVAYLVAALTPVRG
jgi:hypothetical protein